MKRKRKVKPRKPAFLNLDGVGDLYIAGMKLGGAPWDRWVCCLGQSIHNAEDCRKLAAWLILAADYLDSKDERK